MTIEVPVILGVLLTLVAVLMGSLPAVTRPTVPLGVSVPASRLDEPVIRRAVRRFRSLIAVTWLVCIVLLVVLAATAPVAAQLICWLLLIVGLVVAYVVSRRMIIVAKREGDWYEGVSVRVAGTVTAEAEHAPVPVGWFAASIVLLACAWAVGIVLYPTFPESIPTHFALNGTPDAYADKSVWSVFGPLMIGTVVVGGLFALSFVGRGVPIRPLPGVDAETNAHRAHGMRAAMSSLLGQLMFLIAVVFAWTTLASHLIPAAPTVTAAIPIVVVVLIFAAVLGFTLRWRRLMQGDARTVDAARAARRPVDSPDDDRFWKAGIFYVNRDDPALIVQRRFGVGWTINLGRPAGVAIGVGVLVLIVGLLVFVATRVAVGAA